METPLLNAITKIAFIDLNGEFKYNPTDVNLLYKQQISSGGQPGVTEKQAPDLPETIQQAKQARGESNKNAPKGPQATSMTASRDNVANYQPKGIS